MTDGTEYLRAHDVAELTGMHIRTVRRWIADKTIPSTKLGGARLVRKRSLEPCCPVACPPPKRSTEDEDE